VRGNLESFRSSFDPRQLDTWVVRLLAQVDRVPRDDVARLPANTYGGFLAGRDNPKWRLETEERLEELPAKMLSLGLVEQVCATAEESPASVLGVARGAVLEAAPRP
jgi:hypothetical protein